MSKLKEFTIAKARPLPVFLLADISGSMAANGKIDVLNGAVSDMIAAFAEEDESLAEIHVSVITFGDGGVNLHKPLAPASDINWLPMKAMGRTPMGEAFRLANQLIEDRDVVESRAYRPTIILLSDGVPTDDWREPLRELISAPRASKATRFALSIGADADNEPLLAFLGSEAPRVFEASEAKEIRKFFRWVTMSVTSRSRSATPDSVVPFDPLDLDMLDF
jgi:uncharacterized protein YegL